MTPGNRMLIVRSVRRYLPANNVTGKSNCVLLTPPLDSEPLISIQCMGDTKNGKRREHEVHKARQVQGQDHADHGATGGSTPKGRGKCLPWVEVRGKRWRASGRRERNSGRG